MSTTKWCAPNEVSVQPGHLPSLIRVIAVHMKKVWVLSYPCSTQQRCWSDCGCAGCSEHMPFCWFCLTAAQICYILLPFAMPCPFSAPPINTFTPIHTMHCLTHVHIHVIRPDTVGTYRYWAPKWCAPKKVSVQPVWSESLLSIWRKLGSLATHLAHSEDADQTVWMRRLIWAHAILLVLSYCSSDLLYFITFCYALSFLSPSNKHIYTHIHHALSHTRAWRNIWKKTGLMHACTCKCIQIEIKILKCY